MSTVMVMIMIIVDNTNIHTYTYVYIHIYRDIHTYIYIYLLIMYLAYRKQKSTHTFVCVSEAMFCMYKSYFLIMTTTGNEREAAWCNDDKEDNASKLERMTRNLLKNMSRGWMEGGKA